MSSATRVKICGMTQADDAAYAAAAGADAIGIIFYPPSPRYVSDLELAREIAAAVGPFVTVTALFVDPETQWVEQVLKRVPINLLQFHGSEPAEFCEQFGRAYMKALRMKPELDVEKEIGAYESASAILLDAYSPGRAGGTGEQFDWNRVPQGAAKPIVLAGGLSAENVADAVAQVQPYAVDVCGGVEAKNGSQQSYGVKDRTRLEAFISRAKQV